MMGENLLRTLEFSLSIISLIVISFAVVFLQFYIISNHIATLVDIPAIIIRHVPASFELAGKMAFTSTCVN